MKTIAALLAAGSSLLSLAFAADLAEPPANAKTWVIVSAGGQHGEEWVWTDEDGVRRARMKIVLRGLTYDVDHATTVGADGRVTAMEIRGATPSGDARDVSNIQDQVAELHVSISFCRSNRRCFVTCQVRPAGNGEHRYQQETDGSSLADGAHVDIAS
jgi:hypothetical protein